MTSLNKMPSGLQTPITKSQHGAALVMALVILLILTLLGVTAMGTSSLEEKMAGNIQEATRAFEAGESGLNKALNEEGTLDLSATTTKNYSFDSDKSGKAEVQTTFVQYSQAKRGSGYGSSYNNVANFDQVSTGTTVTGAKSVIHQGIAQTLPSSN